MAAAAVGAGDFEDGVKHILDELICSICEEDRLLHVLSCQHRFCTMCLDSVTREVEHFHVQHADKYSKPLSSDLNNVDYLHL